MMIRMKYILRLAFLRIKIFVLILKVYFRSPAFARLLWHHYKMQCRMIKFVKEFRPPEVSGETLDRVSELYGISRAGMSDDELRRCIVDSLEVKKGGVDIG